MARERRRRKFIDSWAQLSIALEVVLHALLLMALVALILFAPPFVGMLSEYSVADHQAIAKDLFYLNLGKWPLFLGLAIFIGIVSILFSHHLVGPAYQFRKVLTKLRNRELDTNVTLRKWDYFGDLQDELNAHIRHLQDDLKRISELQESSANIASEVKAQTSNEKLSDLESELKSISAILQKYKGLESE